MQHFAKFYTPPAYCNVSRHPRELLTLALLQGTHFLANAHPAAESRYFANLFRQKELRGWFSLFSLLKIAPPDSPAH